MSLQRTGREIWRQLGITLLIIFVASMVRALFFSSLGRGIPYLTYYPAVMLAAVYGGLYSGFFATVTSGLLCQFWIQRGTMSPVETLALIVFYLSCTMISFICEATRRAQIAATLAQNRAEIANRAKSVFLANMSHELRTPLNAILGFSSLISNDDSVSPDTRQTLEIINRSGKHLLNLINDVLDMAKVEAGRIQVKEVSFDLRAAVKEVCELLRLRAEAKGIVLTVAITAELPGIIVADEGKLRQVLLNLIGNAIKFTIAGGVTLHLEHRELDHSESVMLIVKVIDTGPGIKQEDQSRAFEPFVQLGHVSDQKGTGLGLSITRQFVEVMGGTITIESDVGKGSQFIVEVPVKISDVAHTIVENVNELRRLLPGEPEYRVLIVDDQEENRLLLQRLLTRAGFLVCEAENGEQGVALFTTWQPHFIWMDWRMPLMDGAEVTRRIRTLEGGREVKIVAVTASVFKEEYEQIMAAGVDDFVLKPIQFGSIYDCMTKHLAVSFSSEQGLMRDADSTSAKGLDCTAMAVLPLALRNELADAINVIDSEQIATIIDRISVMYPLIGEVLHRYADGFHYTDIARLLKNCNDTVLHEEFRL